MSIVDLEVYKYKRLDDCFQVWFLNIVCQLSTRQLKKLLLDYSLSAQMMYSDKQEMSRKKLGFVLSFASLCDVVYNGR